MIGGRQCFPILVLNAKPFDGQQIGCITLQSTNLILSTGLEIQKCSKNRSGQYHQCEQSGESPQSTKGS
jgi:hypothetical protein